MARTAAQTSSAVVAERLAERQEEQPDSHVAQVASSAAAAALAAQGTTVAAAPPAAAITAATKTLIDATDTLFRSRRQQFLLFITGAAQRQMPSADPTRLHELAAQEMAMESEFQRKAIMRLEKDLPVALRTVDPVKRSEAVAKILEREKRFMRQREQAAAQRLVAALEADLLKLASPLGAYWQLSPLIRNHCLECLAFAGKFWPWPVLETLHLPRHPNCGCRLLSLDEAVSQGLMRPDEVGDEQDAVRLAKTLRGEVGRIQETLTDEEQHQLAEQMGLAVQEAGFREILRWGKGTDKGGEFKSKLGGELPSLSTVFNGYAGHQGEKLGYGRHVVLKGQEHFVPKAEDWKAKIGSVEYSSPWGTTRIYRDGTLLKEDAHDLAGTKEAPVKAGGGQGPDTHDWHAPVPPPEPRLVAAPIPGEVTGGPIPNYSQTPLSIGKPAGGSTGAKWAFDPKGQRWLVKAYHGDVDHVATELLANTVYREMGADVAKAGVWRAIEEPSYKMIQDVDVGEPAVPKVKRFSTGVVVREPDGRLWAIEPKGHFGGYEHTFPKGVRADSKLTPQQNAHKELFEETGLTAQITGYLGDYKGTTGTTRYFLATRTGGEPYPEDKTPFVEGGKEAQTVRLFTPEQAAGALNMPRDQKVLKDALETPVVADAKAPWTPHVRTTLAYPTADGEMRKINAPSAALGEHYMTDALLANWDFIGLSDDNVLWGKNGEPIRLDQGGTFRYRAQGSPKDYGPTPVEVWTMKGLKGQGYDKVDLDEAGMKTQAAQIAERLTPEKVHELVTAAPFKNKKMQAEVERSLNERVAWMGRFAEGQEQLPQPLTGKAIAKQQTTAQAKLAPKPEEVVALDGFTEGGSLQSTIQEKLRTKGHLSKVQRGVVEDLEDLVYRSRATDDMTVFRTIDPAALGNLDALVGKVVKDKGFGTATTRESTATAGPGRLRILVPGGAHALYTRSLDGVDGTDPMTEVLLMPGSRLRVKRVQMIGGKPVIDAVLLPEVSTYVPLPGKKPSWKAKKK